MVEVLETNKDFLKTSCQYCGSPLPDQLFDPIATINNLKKENQAIQEILMKTRMQLETIQNQFEALKDAKKIENQSETLKERELTQRATILKPELSLHERFFRWKLMRIQHKIYEKRLMNDMKQKLQHENEKK
jgi:hypothetical protein